MEALQLLVMCRVMADKWADREVIVQLDSLGLVHTLRKARHKHPAINAILTEISTLQIRHGFCIEARWIRRCRNEAADALSKNDMPRFWRNVSGDRTRTEVLPAHLRRPAHSKTGGMRRTKAQTKEWDTRPTHRLAPEISLTERSTGIDLQQQLQHIVHAHDAKSEPLHTTRTGVNHYLRFCERTGRADNVAPDFRAMTSHITAWMADAVQTYHDPHTGRTKKAISTTSIAPYMTHIDHWYAITTGTPRGLLQRDPTVTRHRRLILASYQSACKQVHGITHAQLEHITQRAERTGYTTATLLTAAYTLAWFAMLRPTEYMLTPQHKQFDKTRHLRAGDITFWRAGRQLHAGEPGKPDSMTINVKQSKTDWQRLGANLIVGSTNGRTCPVRAMWKYINHAKPAPDGPLFPGLRYNTMLRMTRRLIGTDGELYGMHSFRVGGAQAMALAGRSAAYIMGRGRWKNIESVSRYVEAPHDVKASDSAAMAQTEQERAMRRNGWGGTHTPSERERLLPRAPQKGTGAVLRTHKWCRYNHQPR